MSGTWIMPTNFAELTLEGLRETLKQINVGLRAGRLTRIILRDDYDNLDWSLPDPFETFDREQEVDNA